MTERTRPRKSVSLDPAIHAYLSRDDVNAARFIDSLVVSKVNHDAIEAAAREAGVTQEETQYGHFDLPSAEDEPADDEVDG